MSARPGGRSSARAVRHRPARRAHRRVRWRVHRRLRRPEQRERQARTARGAVPGRGRRLARSRCSPPRRESARGGYRSAVEPASRVARRRARRGRSDPFATDRVDRRRIGYAEITLDVPSTESAREAAAESTRSIRSSGRADGRARRRRRVLNVREARSRSRGRGCLVAFVILSSRSEPSVAALGADRASLCRGRAGHLRIALLPEPMDVSTAAPTGRRDGRARRRHRLRPVHRVRYRENRAAGQRQPPALSDAMGVVRHAVFFAGVTVVVSMAALALTGMGFITSIGLATSMMVLVAVAAALTLLPAVLSLLGDRIDAWRVVGRCWSPKAGADRRWRLAHRIAGRPWPYLMAVRFSCSALAAPALALNTGFPNTGDNPPTPRTAAPTTCWPRASARFRRPVVAVADLYGTGLEAYDLPASPHASPPTRRRGRRSPRVNAAGRHGRASPTYPRPSRPIPPPRDARPGPGAHPRWGLRDRPTAPTSTSPSSSATSCRCSSPRSWRRRSCC